MMAIISDEHSKVYEYAGGVVYYIENAIAMLNKQYFRCSVKRIYEELNKMLHRPKNLCDLIENVISAVSVSNIKENLTILMSEIVAAFQEVKGMLPVQKKPVTADTIGGTYEEMYSNWRNKMHLAAATGNRHLAFMSLISANAYDNLLDEYHKEYNKACISEKRYPDIDSFVDDYQIKQ